VKNSVDNRRRVPKKLRSADGSCLLEAACSIGSLIETISWASAIRSYYLAMKRRRVATSARSGYLSSLWKCATRRRFHAGSPRGSPRGCRCADKSAHVHTADSPHWGWAYKRIEKRGEFKATAATYKQTAKQHRRVQPGRTENFRRMSPALFSADFCFGSPQRHGRTRRHGEITYRKDPVRWSNTDAYSNLIVLNSHVSVVSVSLCLCAV